MLWLILNSCDVLLARSQEHKTHKACILLNQCHLFSSQLSFPCRYPISSVLPSHLLFSPFCSTPEVSCRLLSWLGCAWPRCCFFHSAVGWKINEANNPENSISSLKCTTWTLKHIALSKYTPCSQKYSFCGDAVYLCSLSHVYDICSFKQILQ